MTARRQLAEMITQLIRDVGFPIVVAGFLLMRVEPAIQNLAFAIHEMTVLLQQNHDLLRELQRSMH